MITLSFAELAQLVSGELRTPRRATDVFRGVSIDSRSLQTGELFVAIRGPVHDGHKYIGQALNAGAAGVLAANDFSVIDSYCDRTAIVTASDSHEALLTLAARYRDNVKATRIGITGTNGKTTTKELTYCLLAAVSDGVYRSPGNYNNLYGMPLAILSMPQHTRLAVLEMGISRRGEMRTLAELVRPQVMVFTNVGPSHLEFLGAVEQVAHEKASVIETMNPDSTVIVNADDSVLLNAVKRYGRALLTFGKTKEADIYPDGITYDDDGVMRVMIDDHKFRLPLFGQHQVYNLLAAYAVCQALGLSFDGADTETIALDTAPMRGQVISLGGVTFINDCYNANPVSMRLGLDSFAEYPTTQRRVVILGDMLELGEHEVDFHRAAGKQLAELSFDLVILVGQRMRSAYEAARTGCPRLTHYDTAAACAEEIHTLLHARDVVYLKASRGVGLEVIITAWSEENA